MKRIKLLTTPLLMIAAFLPSCKKDEMLNNCTDRTTSDPTSAPDAAFTMAGNVPIYTMAEFNALIANTTEEEALFKKVEMLTFAIIDFIGSRTNFNDNGSLAGSFPCDENIFELGGGVMRMMGERSGLTEIQVRNELNTRIKCLVTNCNSQPIETQNYMFTLLLNSLQMEGEVFALVAKRPETIVSNTSNELFLGYGIYFNQSGQSLAAGFRYQLNSNVVSLNRSLPLSTAMNRNMLLLDIVPVIGGMLRENNPCYYLTHPGGHGSSGGSGSSGGGGDLDDDGYKRGEIPGPLVDLELHSCPAGILDGLRVTEFHLADRNEGGWFSGRSEVYVHASFYKSVAPNPTVVTNTEVGTETEAVYISPANVCYVAVGKWLADVSPSSVYPTGNEIYFEDIIDASSQVANDWIIVSDGFCGAPDGYNRVMLSIYERDNIDHHIFKDNNDFKWKQNLDWTSVDTCKWHFMFMNQETDDWFSNKSFNLTYDQFVANGGVLWLTEVPGGYSVNTSRPSDPAVSWFKIVLY